MHIIQERLIKGYKNVPPRPFIKILPSSYTNSITKATFVDEEYGEWEATPNTVVIRGSNHPTRSLPDIIPFHIVQKRLTYGYKSVPPRKFILLKVGTYSGMAKKATFIDAKYGEWEAVPSNVVLLGTDHPARSSQTSSLEIKVSKSLNIGKNTSRLKVGSGFIIPDFIVGKLLVECDGLHWHSEKYRGKWHHFKRREIVESAGYKLLQFREDEINNKFPIVISTINKELNNCKTIPISKCKLGPVSAKISYQFFSNHHLTTGNRLKAFGLHHEGKLIQLINFQNRGSNTHVRFCSARNIKVVGGMQEILRAIINTQKPKFVVTSVNLRYSSVKELEELGFKLVGKYLSWEWTKGQKTFNRRQKIGSGWCKIYDAGQAKYIMSV